jgi:hypothetical protein
VRLMFKIALALLVGLAAFIFLGPLAPEGTFLADWSKGLRETMNAWWGFPLGFN